MHIRNIFLLSILFLAVDSVYLYLMGDFAKSMIYKIQGSKLTFRVLSAFFCYLFLIFGLYHFIILKKASLLEAFLFGLIIYGVYETTNHAIIKNWDLRFVFLDTLWGGFLFLITTYLYRNIYTLL